jgi:hypothetical protein
VVDVLGQVPLFHDPISPDPTHDLVFQHHLPRSLQQNQQKIQGPGLKRNHLPLVQQFPAIRIELKLARLSKFEDTVSAVDHGLFLCKKRKKISPKNEEDNSPNDSFVMVSPSGIFRPSQ